MSTQCISEWRYFAIPGNGNERWDPTTHGKEISEGDLGGGVAAEISWKPGLYSFSIGSGGMSYDFHLPDAIDAKLPNQQYLRAIHEFLKVAYDEHS